MGFTDTMHGCTLQWVISAHGHTRPSRIGLQSEMPALNQSEEETCCNSLSIHEHRHRHQAMIDLMREISVHARPSVASIHV